MARSDPPSDRLTVTYLVRSTAAEIDARALAIAVEQSVEMPVAPIEDPFVRDTIIGQVAGVADRGDGQFEVRISLSAISCGKDAGQLFNMLFGNSSIQDDLTLLDVDLPKSLVQSYCGPRHGLAGLRARVGAQGRALTGSALKPQGLSPEGLGALAGRLAMGGLDYIKDDHGLAEQTYSPFAARVPAVMKALRSANAATGRATRYIPSLTGSLDAMRSQLKVAHAEGVDCVLISPMIAGLSTFQTLVAGEPEIAFFTHPALAGASRIAPPVHFGKLFRLIGADGVVYPNYGGRFAYSPETCRAIAQTATGAWDSLKPSVPIPAGGMTAERVPEMLAFYGPDVLLLIGGGLLAAGKDLTAATKRFVTAVETYRY